MTSPAPRAAYIHIPFCRRRCGYCNFAVVADRHDLEASYLAALQRELYSLGAPVPVDSLFIGGGTPTQLSLDHLRQLCHLVRQWFACGPEVEWSVEANPADCHADKLDVLAEAGVNRLSIGVQSWRADKLLVLERDHTPDQACQAVELAAQRFPNLSIDLMFGVPGETLSGWRAEIERALDADLQHLSTYGLTVEKGTTFWGRQRRGQLRLPSQSLQRAMYESAIDRLVTRGWEQYEISNFARSGYRCRHNLVYWTGEPYYGFGVGAARFVDGVRQTNHQSTSTYVRRMQSGAGPVSDVDELSPEERAREQLIFRLRLIEGVDEREFERRTGFAPRSLAADAIAKYERLGLLESVSGRLRMTRSGLMISDVMWPDFL